VSLGHVSLGLRVGVRIQRSEDLHGLVVARLDFQHLLKALGGLEIVAGLVVYRLGKGFIATYIFGIPPIDVHLTKPVVRQHKVRWRNLSGLVIVLEGLIVVALGVEAPGQLVTALGSHRLVLGVVEGVQR